MTLHNYWWLLIWLFLFGGVCFVFVPSQEEIVLGERVVRWNWLPAAILALPFVFWAAWRPDGFGDTGMYRLTFSNMPVGFGQFSSYFLSSNKDRGFVLLEFVFKTLISQSDIAFFFVIALIQMFCIVRIYRKYSRDFWLSLFLFVASTDYLSWMHNGMRQFLAASLIFSCIPLIVRRQYLSMILVVLVASQIHLSSLIFLPFIFIVNGHAWNLRTLAFLIGVVLSIVFIDRVTGFITEAMEDTSYSGDIVYMIQDDGTNILRVLFYSVPAILSWVFRPYIDSRNEPIINMCVNLATVAAGLYLFSYFSSGILIGRLPIYFSLANYILIPWLISEAFKPNSVSVVKAGFVIVYTFFFYYQVGITWHLI